MSRIRKIANGFTITARMITYNLKIIFANKFIWFLAGAIAFYVSLSLIYVFSEEISRAEDLFGVFIFCGLLIVFYPTVFGIQNDQDARTIEILFGIPNYRYKVWLVRMGLIYIITFIILMVFVYLSSALIIRMPVLAVTYHVLYPVFFMGVMSFMVSTLVRNGNGTAVIMIIFSLFFLILQDTFARSKWNVFLNPFQIPNDVTESAWSNIVRDNRIILIVATLLFLLAALYNLQKREKFI
ncbi:MAG: hypothetical protein R2744_00995 [Bacteroidales bacterium]